MFLGEGLILTIILRKKLSRLEENLVYVIQRHGFATFGTALVTLQRVLYAIFTEIVSAFCDHHLPLFALDLEEI